ncbi:MAG: serine/threonine-protein kinase [Acidobacteriota bacterium]|nr:serine/threonine-protein kinase [Acidobacteriota bacterium]
MSPESWEKINNLFHDALEVEPKEREAFLRDNCDSAEVRDEVLALLAAHEGEENFLQETAFSAGLQHIGGLEAEDFSGKRVGAYKITGELGRGGMGAVFSAARVDGEFEQRVAIKLLPRSILSGALLERFRRERQILANLNHPFIARLFDGGATVEEIPFIVMELVRGDSIIEFCRRRDLSIDERLKLFLKICEAVRYAHAQGVVHRDLKPSNILINEDGEPKLLDFGIAKFLQSEASDDATTGGFSFLTPEYSSPEQVSGLPVTVQTDVYSLGIILYELLTDARPYKFENRSPMGIARVICETEPESPSSIVLRRSTVGGNQTTQPNKQILNGEGQKANLLSKDLDFIVLKALRKDTARRYASVAEFADDIERFLQGLPVKAAPDRFVYRAQKFVARHRTIAVAACCAVIFVVFAGSFVVVKNFSRKSSARAFAKTNLPTDNAVRLTNNAGDDTQPHWSPDGRAIYFASNRPPQRGIYRMNADGSNPVLFSAETDRQGLTPSPDGKLVFYKLERGGRREMYAANADFSGEHKISTCDGSRCAWSPDSRRIAYGCKTNGNMEVFAVDVAAANGAKTERNLTNNASFDTDAAWSPDSRQIAFTSARDGQLEVYVMNADGSNQKRLTDNAADDSLPVFSPDARRIAFVSNRDGDADIYIMNAADGTGVQRVTYGAGNDSEPAWSPDGRRIAFESDRDGNTEIYSISLAGDAVPNAESEFTDEIEGSPAPDGKRIVFSSNRTGQFQIYSIDADGSNLRQLTSEGVNHYPSFSPDGAQIIFDRAGDDNVPAIYRMNADGTNQTAIFAAENLRGFQRFSPDSSRIAFVKSIETGDNIFTINADGGDERQLTFDKNGNQFPAWTAGGESIIFSSWNDGKLGIRSVGADGSNLHEILTGLVGQPDAASDGRIAFQSKQSGAWEIWLMDADGSNQHQLTFSGANILNERPRFSADGKIIIYDSNERDLDRLRVLRLP